MDSWGRGPWFEPAEDTEPETDDVSAQADEEKEVASQPPVQPRVTGGPRPTLPPLPGSISRPLARQAGLHGMWGPDAGLADAGSSGADADGVPTERVRAVMGPGASGSNPRPAMPSRPLPPDAFPQGRIENRLGDDLDTFGGFAMASSPLVAPARPLVPPVPDPAGDADLRATGPALTTMAPVANERLPWAGAAPAPARTPPAHGGQGARGTRSKPGDGGRKRRRRLWPIALGLVVLLIVCSTIGLLESGLLPGGSKANNTGGGGVLAQQPSATSESTATASTTSTSTSGLTSTPKSKGSSGGGAPAPTATPIPPPTAATLSFSPASQQLSSPAQMTSCPSGCDLTGQTVGSSQPFSVQNAASQILQTQLLGTIMATNKGATDVNIANFQFTGGGWACEAQPIILQANASSSYACLIFTPAPPSTVAAHTINGTVPGTSVQYDQPNDLTGNGHYEVLQQDCTAALNTLHGQGTTWAQAWFSSQASNPGLLWASAQPQIAFTDNCPLGQKQQTPFNFTASTSANAQASAYNPAAAQQLAANRLSTLLPGGYQWQSGSPTTCSPTVSGVAGNGTVTLNCSDTGLAVYVWSNTLRSQMAGNVAGQTKVQALAICNSNTGVKSGSCTVAIQGGDGSVLPASASAVTVTVGAP